MRISRPVAAAAVAAVFTFTTVGPIGSVASANSSLSAGLGDASGPAFFLLKKKKKKKKKKGGGGGGGAAPPPPPGLTPEQADGKRKAIYDSVQADREAGKLDAVANGLEENAELLGDPIAMQEAGAVRLEQAKKERSADAAQASIVTTQKALDMLHFYDAVASGTAESTWLPIDPSTASGMIGPAEEQIAAAESLIEELEAETKDKGKGKEEKQKKEKKPKKKRDKAKPGTGLIAAGSVFIVVGAAGIGLGVGGLVVSGKRQDEVEKVPDPTGTGAAEVERLDKEGKSANTLGFVGLGIAAVGLAVGIPLVVVGAKKRKQAGPGSQARLQVIPAFGRTESGVVVQGRF